MGVWDNLKKSGKKFVKNQQEVGKVNAKARAERREYEKKVQQSVLTARREAFHTEAQKQARIRAKIDAQRKFNPSPSQQASGGMTAEARSIIYGSGWGSPTPAKQQVVSHIQKQRSSPKKKKKKKSKTRVVYKTVQPQKDPLHDLLYNS